MKSLVNSLHEHILWTGGIVYLWIGFIAAYLYCILTRNEHRLWYRLWLMPYIVVSWFLFLGLIYSDIKADRNKSLDEVNEEIKEQYRTSSN